MPLSPRALTDALNQRTSVLCGLLLQLRWAVGLCTGLTVLAGSYGLAPLRSGVAALFPELAGPLEPAVTGLLALLTVAAALLCWGSLAAGGALAAVAATLSGRTGAEDSALPLRRWLRTLTVWQWSGTLLGLVAGAVQVVVFTVLLASVAQSASEALRLIWPTDSVQESPAETARQMFPFALMGGTLSTLPVLVLAGLTLAAVRRLFARIGETLTGSGAASSAEAGTRVQAAAGVAAGWMQFCRVALGLGVVLGLLNFLFSLPNLFSGSGPGETIQLVLGSPVLVPLGWLYTVLFRLAGHSRLFALEAASVLGPPHWGQAHMSAPAQAGQVTKDL